MSEYTIEKLKRMYEAGKQCDESLFAEQRTNIRLRMGDHYKKKSSDIYEELRTRGVQTKENKIRLTKNNIHRITNTYQNAILEGNPSVSCVPFNEDELHDVKVAELNNSVISWVKDTNTWEEKQEKFVHDMVNIGEIFAKIRFDYSKGPKSSGVDDEGNVQDFNTGEFVIDRMYGFDVKRDPAARDKEESRWWMHEQMIDMSDFKKLVKKLSPDMDEKIQETQNETIKIFDANTGAYKEVKDKILVIELFVKPDEENPNGWYVMFTENIKVTEGELPLGIFPIVFQTFDDLTTSPRGVSIIRVCRPYQIEINRASSKIAEHQITLGDDKVYIQKGTKISNGGTVNGVRAIQISGQAPVIQSGRSGDQYLSYLNSQIKEMYDAANVGFLLDNKQPTGDAYQMLFAAMKDKKVFSMYASKFERFEIQVFKTILKMSKSYLNDYHVIKIAGKNEQINIEEFKNTDETGFEFKMIAQSGDSETKMGKILSITQTLQYAGTQLQPDQIGTLIKQLPFGNEKQIFTTLTSDSENAVNDILSMDRGEMVEVNPNENHLYAIQALNHRMKKSDFRFLSDVIKNNYKTKVLIHSQYLQQEKMAQQQSTMGMIPTGGFLTTVNASWYNPTSKRVERIKVPSSSLEWLVKKLETQGVFNQQASQIPPQATVDMVNNEVLNAPELQGLQAPQEQNINISPQG